MENRFNTFGEPEDLRDLRETLEKNAAIIDTEHALTEHVVAKINALKEEPAYSFITEMDKLGKDVAKLGKIDLQSPPPEAQALFDQIDAIREANNDAWTEFQTRARAILEADKKARSEGSSELN